MNQVITDLLAIATDAIGDAVQPSDFGNDWGPAGNELCKLLTAKNGFYAFESALLVRPFHNALDPLGIIEWNCQSLWRSAYQEPLGDALFFAEDVFGGQYCIHEHQVCTFDPETGQFDTISDSLEGWARVLMADYQFRTGYPLAHAWQLKFGPLPIGMRLIAKIPFVCGGKYELENLHLVNDLKGILFRASIANQIRDLPEGAEIVLNTGDDSEASVWLQTVS